MTYDIPIEIRPELTKLYRDDQQAQLSARQEGGGWAIGAWARDDLTADEMESLQRWVNTTVDQLLESNDPIANGWYPSTLAANTWFMVATVRRLPEI